MGAAAVTRRCIKGRFLGQVKASADGTPRLALPGAYQLATRLSYFLWSSMPDDVLTAAAPAGGLAGNPSAIQAQVTRMLADPKAAAFAQHYGAQWLEVHFLDTVIPDPKIFPGYTDALRTSALKETVLFFQQLVAEGLPLQSLVTANFSMLNATLGKQYGVSVSGDNFVKTSLVGTQRVGILTQDSLLMGKSYADRTSPVKRGYFVLSQLLCTPPPPPRQRLANRRQRHDLRCQVRRRRRHGQRGAPCQFVHTVSYDANNALPHQVSPLLAFNSLFTGTSPTASTSDAARRQALRKSVLDHVLAETQSLRPTLSSSDRGKLDQYQTSVRTVEAQIQNMASSGGQCSMAKSPAWTLFPMPRGWRQ